MGRERSAGRGHRWHVHAPGEGLPAGPTPLSWRGCRWQAWLGQAETEGQPQPPKSGLLAPGPQPGPWGPHSVSVTQMEKQRPREEQPGQGTASPRTVPPQGL